MVSGGGGGPGTNASFITKEQVKFWGSKNDQEWKYNMCIFLHILHIANDEANGKNDHEWNWIKDIVCSLNDTVIIFKYKFEINLWL